MRISIPVNHNYYEEAPISEYALGDAFAVNRAGIKKLKEELFSSVYELKLGAEQLKQIRIFNFKRKGFEHNEERQILKLYSKEKGEHRKEYFIQTGLYAGRIFYKGCKINITTKYGDAFLKRMLNFVNNIYVDNEHISAKKDESENQLLFIIAYLFIQSLEKAAVLGLPQQYIKHQERSHKVRGGIDFHEYLKRDIPFKGTITSNFRERKYVREIVDVLYLALRKLERFFGEEIHSRLLGLSQLLTENYSGQYSNYATIQKAKASNTISNPMYSGFKRVLDYAEIILLDKDLMPDNENQQLATTGYLFDIAELFELYLEKLLSRNFPEWSVSGQDELRIYQQQFYGRPMYPDLVMTNKITGDVVVFDAKFKNMAMRNADIDRMDLHQIHSYSGYYGNKLIASGLIYPFSKEIIMDKAHSKSIYGTYESGINFIIDGIFVSDTHSMKDLIRHEDEFINRIASVIKRN